MSNPSSTILGTGRHPVPHSNLGPKANNHSAIKAYTCPRRLAPALSLHPSPWYQAHIGGERPPPTSAPPPLHPGDKQLFFGVLGNHSGLSNTFCCVIPLLSHPLPSSAYTIHIFTGLPGGPSHCSHAEQGASEILPFCQRTVCCGERGGIRRLPRLGWRE